MLSWARRVSVRRYRRRRRRCCCCCCRSRFGVGVALAAGSFETDGADFEAKGLVRLTVIDREEIDNGQLAQLVAADLEDGFTAALAVLIKRSSGGYQSKRQRTG